MKRSMRLAVTAGILLLGSGLAAYPFVSNYLYERQQDEVIVAYDKQLETLEEDSLTKEWERAKEYNKLLRTGDIILTDPFDPKALSRMEAGEYEKCLNPGGDGVMGYLDIPVLDLHLSIYHGTGARVLERGVGHLEMTSLPTGETGNHTVLSAHAGLPGKKLFTDLEMLEEGDVFFLRILDEVFAYEVDQTKVVLPDDTKDLRIEAEKDYITLLTCTPYGVNSHRLLVRGERIPYEEAREIPQAEHKDVSKSPWMRQYFYGVLVGFGILAAIWILYQILQRKREEHES